MGLKQLMLDKKIKQRQAQLEELKTKFNIEQREADLTAALEEAQSEEEVQAVEESVAELDADKETYESEKGTLETEIESLERELDELEKKEPEKGQQRSAAPQQQKIENRGGYEIMKKGMETRAMKLERLNNEEVRSFYDKVREAVLNKRALSGLDLLIPEMVMNVIRPRIGDYSNLYNEVEVVQLNGTARAIFDGNIPEAIWTEMCDPVEELAFAFEPVELDGFKVGGFVPVCNAVLEDSLINLADYLEDRIARAIGKALDKAILTGTGAAAKQPEGIIPAVTANAVDSDFTFADFLPNLGAIDTGDDEVGEVIAVMKRSTYYKYFMPQSITPTADGRFVAQGVTSPNIAGLRVVFSQYAPADAAVLGDFKQYLLGERAGTSLTSSTDVRFIQDQTVFKGTARYDGKPVNDAAFLLVNFVAPAPEV